MAAGDEQAFGDAPPAGFTAVVKIALQQAHATDQAVPGRENGVAAERRPDGIMVLMDATRPG